MRWPRWMHDALRLRTDEVERVRPGLPDTDLDLLRTHSEQPDEGVDLLIRRLSQGQVMRRRRPWFTVPIIVGMAAVAAAAAFTLVSLDSTPTTDDLRIATDTTLVLNPLTPLDLGPSIRVSGLADLVIEQASDTGTVVRIEHGAATFDVDPTGPFRALTVHAADAVIDVTGTRFTVVRLYDAVRVEVFRGAVDVTWRGETTAVLAGSAWTHEPAWVPPPVVIQPDEPAVAAVEAPPDGPAMVSPFTPTPVNDAVTTHAVAPPSAVDAQVAYAAILDALDGGEPPASVARSLGAFARQFPNSALKADATALGLELAAELESPEVVIRHVDAWIATHPDHPRRLALITLRATLARDRLHDCALALPSYRILVAEQTGPAAATASALLGLCALDVGDRDEARAALDRAIALDVAEPLRNDVLRARDQLDL